MSNKIIMIDYGASNIRSALKAFEHLGADVRLTSRPEDVSEAEKVVLPGVGAFGSGMEALGRLKLIEAIQKTAARGVPLLGICVGMQFLFERSEEMGDHQGLGLIPGKVARFSANGLKIPHMGWNQIMLDADHTLVNGVKGGSYVYFVHSYHCLPTEAEDIVATADYGGPFAAIVARKNVWGIQFHPEKSHALGLQILKNFIEYEQDGV